MPLYPRNVMSQGMYPIPYPSVVFTFKLTIKSIKEFRGALDFA
jgi:hypothetical protein